MRFWAQLQREELAKNTLIMMSRQLEMIGLERVKGGWQHIYRLL